MRLHQLRYFVAVADFRSFRRAAERCYVSQPSLSQQIIKLEKEIGHPLFERLGRSVRLTEVGEALLPKARGVLGSFDAIEAHIADSLDQGRGKLVVGSIPTMAPFLLPAALASFRKVYKEARIVLHESLTEELVQRVVDGQIDVAIMSLPIEHDLIETRLLFEELMHVCLHADSPLAKLSKVRLDQLADKPAVVLHSMHCLGRQISSFCQQVRMQQNTVCYSSQISTVQAMVSMGLGYSLLPEMCARTDRDSSRVYIPVQGVPPKRAIAAAWRKGGTLSRLSQDFLTHIAPIMRRTRIQKPGDNERGGQSTD